MLEDKEKSPANWAAWCFGLILVVLILIVTGYMFVVYLRSQRKKNQLADETGGIEIENSIRDPVVINNSLASRSCSENKVKKQSPESTEQDDFSKTTVDETIKEKSEKQPKTCAQKPKVPIPKASTPKTEKLVSKEPSTEELSVKNSLTDLKNEATKMANTSSSANRTGEISVEIVSPKPTTAVQASTPEKPMSSAESAMESSIGSDISTYIVSSKRSEVNNYNMIEAGRTPPMSFSESYAQTAIPTANTPPTVVHVSKPSSETSVSIPPSSAVKK